MKIDTISGFGEYEPSPLVKRLLRFGHVSPNFVGQQFAQLLRKYLIKSMSSPIDIEVENLKYRFYLRDNNSESKFAFMPWRFDKKERDFMSTRLNRDSVFLDIGANVGIYTLSAAKQIGSDGQVLAFEPNPPVCERLKYNISCQAEHGICPNIEVLNIGLSSEEETINLYLDNKNLGGCSIIPKEEGEQSAVEIQCLPLTKVLQERDVHKVDFLKIDIEGAEDKVLAPFFEQAESHLFPKNIVIENSQKQWSLDLFEVLNKCGYKTVFKTRLNTALSLDF